MDLLEVLFLVAELLNTFLVASNHISVILLLLFVVLNFTSELTSEFLQLSLLLKLRNCK